ncbi:taste receptor type 2 member 117-like [Perognathus longimembris pacificus]|uniref:taste receptor type 2 member 117-like n=1 Tax=Perognathus longimembris pacificus TaxID=214514 RepID=UPI00201943E8|nr:taste receptor type 2 member 117-like [Perognathus longimembris pacificus]
MASLLLCTLTAVLSMEFLVGNVGNGFVVLVNCRAWLGRRKMSAVDQILTTLAISRIGMLGVTFLNYWVTLCDPSVLMNANILRTIYIPWAIVNHFSLWLATSLSIYYFLRIANFSNAFFLYLKYRVKMVVSGTLLVSLALLLANTVLMNLYIDVWIHSSETNASSTPRGDFAKLLLTPSFIFSILPFLISLAAFLLLIVSLWKHGRRMLAHRSAPKGGPALRGPPAPRDSRTAAHIWALSSVIAFLLLYTLFFLAFLLQICKFEFLEKSLIILFCQVMALAFPMGHSIVLILGTRKLRGAALSALGGCGVVGHCRRPGGLGSLEPAAGSGRNTVPGK